MAHRAYGKIRSHIKWHFATCHVMLWEKGYMKVSNIAKLVCTVSFASVLAMGLVACNSEDEIDGLTGGIAATVNGVEIEEDTITKYIHNFRQSAGLESDESWGEYLKSIESTPEMTRQTIIDSHIQNELIKEVAEANGLTVDAAELDAAVNEMKSNYDSEERWEAALEQANTTEDAYRESLEIQMMTKSIREEIVEVEDPTDEELLEYAKMYASAYNGAKKSSHILFNLDDRDTAEEILDKVKSGELDFAEAAKEYSQDTGSAENGGNAGWDKLSNFVTEYADAVAQLELGEISSLVESTYGYHIITVTEIYEAPDEVTDLNQIPEEFLENVEATVLSNKKNEAYTSWYEGYKETADIVVNPMPEEVPYNIDPKLYETEEKDEGDSTDQGDGNIPENPDNGEGAGEGDGENTTGDTTNENPDAGADTNNGDGGSDDNTNDTPDDQTDETPDGTTE